LTVVALKSSAYAVGAVSFASRGVASAAGSSSFF
jgi:hypothetical protein